MISPPNIHGLLTRFWMAFDKRFEEVRGARMGRNQTTNSTKTKQNLCSYKPKPTVVLSYAVADFIKSHRFTCKGVSNLARPLTDYDESCLQYEWSAKLSIEPVR